MPSDMTAPLAAEFPAETRDAWLKLVDKVLKGGDFEKRLVARTADGLAIQPLYTRADAPADAAAAPGMPPFTRGGGRRDGLAWDIRQRVADPEPELANLAALADLEGGVSSLVLTLAAPGQTGIAPADLGRVLAGVLLDVCPVHLEPGDAFTAGAAAMLTAWETAGVGPALRQGGYGADPTGTIVASGRAARRIEDDLAAGAALAVATTDMPGVTTFRADGRPYHAAGASDAQELAAVLATLVTQIRAMTAAGLAVPAAVQAIAVTVAADTDQFGTIVKLRALRRLMWRVADACGAGDAAGRIEVTAETATRMLARRDPWVNLLRTTVATAAAALGGANAVTVQPFTAALGRPDAFARRMARNTQIVLMEEASLGRVADPAGGSWYVERATDDLARAAWRLFQEIEAEGGLVAALRSGHVQDIIKATAATRSSKLATGHLAMTGVSAFPKLGSDGVTVAPWPAPPPDAAAAAEAIEPLPPCRLAAPFEALRDRADCAAAGGRPPRIFLANLGTLADFNVRATWIANYLAAGGIDALPNDGFTQSADVGRAFAESGTDVACICSTDAIYAELAEATASLLKTAGAKAVCLAGRPKDQEAAFEAAGVDLFIQAGSHAPDVLTRLHDLLGTPG